MIPVPKHFRVPVVSLKYEFYYIIIIITESILTQSLYYVKIRGILPQLRITH